MTRLIHNARIVLANETVRGQLLIEDGRIHAIDTGSSGLPQAEDWGGDWLLPGLVEIHTDNLNPAHVYGRGLAPFFFSIALWVFGLFAYLLLKPVNLRALADRVNPVTIAVAGSRRAAVAAASAPSAAAIAGGRAALDASWGSARASAMSWVVSAMTASTRRTAPSVTMDYVYAHADLR